jgi:hypothetical protein
MQGTKIIVFIQNWKHRVSIENYDLKMFTLQSNNNEGKLFWVLSKKKIGEVAIAII